jgi:hypothetical protein
VRKAMAAVVTAVLVTVSLAGVALVRAHARGNATESRQGLMPEVVVTAEMPRMVMPTVEVRAFRTLAMSTPSLNVN